HPRRTLGECELRNVARGAVAQLAQRSCATGAELRHDVAAIFERDAKAPREEEDAKFKCSWRSWRLPGVLGVPLRQRAEVHDAARDGSSGSPVPTSQGNGFPTMFSSAFRAK